MSSGAIQGTASSAASASLHAARYAPEPRWWGLITPTGMIMALALAVPLIVLFRFFLDSQNQFSWGSGDWSHAYMVPLISIYVLWQRRAEMAVAPVRVFWPGLIPLLLSIPIYGLFQFKAIPGTHMVQGWAMLLCIFGLVLLLCGPSVARIALVPIAYLLFGITISEQIMIQITFQLQLIAAKGAWALLNMIGVPTDIGGNVLKVITSKGVHPLNVAEACSGMRMVIAFAALGVAVALVGVKHWWARVLLIVLAVPVALLMNVVRVAVLGIATLYDSNLAAGQSHMLIGTILLVPAFFLYMAIVWALNRVVREDEPAKAAPLSPGPQGAFSVRWANLGQPAFVTAMVVLVAGAAGLSSAVGALGANLRKQSIAAPDDRKVSAIPTETASFIRAGQDTVYSEEFQEELGTANHLTRAYIRKGTPKDQKPVRLELHLAYYTGMIDTVPHVADRCMVGAGLQMINAPRNVPLKLDSTRWTPERDETGKTLEGRWRARIDFDHSDAKLDRVRLPRDPQTIQMRISQFADDNKQNIFAGYFFIANGGHVPDAEGVRLLAFKLEDDYAYYLKVQVSSNDVPSPEDLATNASALLSELLPEIMRCVPDWVDVQSGNYPSGNPRQKALNDSRQ